jgi:hypothetical protein
MLSHSGRNFSHAHAFEKLLDSDMEEGKIYTKNKGGRPRKDVKRDRILSLKCSVIERKLICENAKKANLSVSEYLRKMGLTGKIDRCEKVIPKEILVLTGTLNHLAANLNQIARKRNGIEELNALERAGLEVQSRDLKRLAIEIRSHLK